MTNGIRILIVEDDDLIRTLLGDAMEDDGFHVQRAATADDAARRLRAGTQIDLLMTDIQLPGRLDGLDLAHEARRHMPDLPIIFTTGQPDRMMPWPPGAADLFVPKPYRPSEICVAARQLIARLRG